jgi:hypothetical protein
METDGRGVVGRRDLDDGEVALINDILAMEACWNCLIDRLRATPGIDQRNVSMAATHGEDAFARAVRAVEQPLRLTVPSEHLARFETA